jgi:hypothetical protein
MMLLEEDNCRTHYTVHFPHILQYVQRLMIIFPYSTGPVYFDWRKSGIIKYGEAYVIGKEKNGKKPLKASV